MIPKVKVSISNISSPIFFHNLASQQHQLYFFLLPSSTGNQEDEPSYVISNDNVFCDDSNIASSSASEELQGEVSPLHTLPAERDNTTSRDNISSSNSHNITTTVAAACFAADNTITYW